MTVSASVETEEQFNALLDIEDISLIYVSDALLRNEVGKDGTFRDIALKFLNLAKKHGKEMAIALPYIERMDTKVSSKEEIDFLMKEGLSGFLIRSFESLSRLASECPQSMLISDSSLYTMNNEAGRFIEESGCRKDTAPLELNRRQLYGRDCRRSEIIAYGFLPLMVTAQCLRKNTEECTGRTGQFLLNDRKGSHFPVKNECIFCYNILYNSVPLSLLDEGKAIRRMGFSSARLSFTMENAAETAAVSKTAVEEYIYGRETGGFTGEHTKGHFNRGVE